MKTPEIKNFYNSNLRKNQLIDSIYSNKKLGITFSNDEVIFRIFVPNAVAVTLCIFNSPEDIYYEEFELYPDESWVWEVITDKNITGKFYNYLIYKSEIDFIKLQKTFILDPYAKFITKKNIYLTPAKGIILETGNYDWESDDYVTHKLSDLIIYEGHLRDFTAHNSSSTKNRGTYQGFIDAGIPYLKELGINAVEFLPIQSFTNYEIPFNKALDKNNIINTWNPYERNHWGYMTMNYFTPESYYFEGKLTLGEWSGLSGKQNDAFKDVVKSLHKENIAVIMDVVYNHFAQYIIGGLKDIDKDYYFRHNLEGHFTSDSGCGNDLKTENKMVRKLILDSLLYWIEEYHIDGFRFDLAKLLDWETIEEIEYELKKIHPKIILIAEPWMGGYDPAGFSFRNFAAWNDQFRNCIKGENPSNNKGWMLNHWFNYNSIQKIKNYATGTILDSKYDKGGLFLKPEHSVNYLEAHDGYTLGDFIRIALGKTNPGAKIRSKEHFIQLEELELKIHKLAAGFLFASSGIIMISQGQEYARSKIIFADKNIDDKNKQKIDHDSYNKDNSTNYINYKHIAANSELLDFYKNLIAIRNSYEVLRTTIPSNIDFIEFPENNFALGIIKRHCETEIFCFFNANDYITTSYNFDNNFDILISSNIEISDRTIKLLPKSFFYLIIRRTND